jgi:hypothetical protein
MPTLHKAKLYNSYHTETIVLQQQRLSLQITFWTVVQKTLCHLASLHRTFYTGIFMIHFHTQFHMPSSNGLVEKLLGRGQAYGYDDTIRYITS